MKNQSKLDIAIKACQDTLEEIKKQQEFNKFHSTSDVVDDMSPKEFQDFKNEELYGNEGGPEHTVENWDGETREDKWFADSYLEN